MIDNRQTWGAETENAVVWLESWCASHGLGWHEMAHARFCMFIEKLLHCQQQTNLTGFSTPKAIVESLFVDSLQILRVSKFSGALLDVGTGAGFPAIPIKILRPELVMILVEPRTKRYAFLRLIERELGLEGLTIHKARIESVSVPEDLGVAISKAFAPLPEWLEHARPWANHGARVACLVSRVDWDAAQSDMRRLGYVVENSMEEQARVYGVLKFEG